MLLQAFSRSVLQIWGHLVQKEIKVSLYQIRVNDILFELCEISISDQSRIITSIMLDFEEEMHTFISWCGCLLIPSSCNVVYSYSCSISSLVASFYLLLLFIWSIVFWNLKTYFYFGAAQTDWISGWFCNTNLECIFSYFSWMSLIEAWLQTKHMYCRA